MTKQLAIRLDGGGIFGFGHAKRCVALSKFLEKEYNIKSYFFSRFNKNLEEFYLENKVEYQFSFKNDDFEEEGFIYDILEKGYKVLFLDKLFPYSEDLVEAIQKRCKLVLFHNDCKGLTKATKVIFPIAHLSSEVLELINSLRPGQVLHGPKYILLNEEVTNFRNTNSEKNYIAITTGASDPEGVMLSLLRWINESNLQQSFVFLEGFDLVHKVELREYQKKLRENITVKPFSYSLLFNSSLVISAFGVTTYEVIYHKIPIFTIGHALNNAIASKNLEKNYSVNIDFGFFRELSQKDFISKFENLIINSNLFESIKENQTNFGLDHLGIHRIGKEVDLIFKNYE
ncbi:hypothetical protein [Flexithrix dorotheae]|uniref:hypothetical protein n=1 Tax=Flexithrix dorotheae TaxID=70993 RepID=UPI000373B624|nr:hypothetical protein [Flexithrix dorotheae]